MEGTGGNGEDGRPQRGGGGADPRPAQSSASRGRVITDSPQTLTSVLL